MTSYRFDEDRYFVIENYDKAKTFSSFLPGIAGLYGVPIWSFYVNRGQGIASFGVENKNNAITEFFPANVAYQRVSVNGFRTFLKVDGQSIYEPFSPYVNSKETIRNMYIKENELKIEEISKEKGIKTTVTYFTLPNENFGALVRKVEVENQSGEERHFEVLDGLPAIIPFGIEDAAYKAVGNTLKSWMDVFNLENSIPYYRVRSSTADSAEVEQVTKGHFYISFTKENKLLTPVVDADLVFGMNTSLSYPNQFEENGLESIIHAHPVTANKVPCGFSPLEKTLEAEEVLTFYTLAGHVKDIEIINRRVAEIARADYAEQKYKEAQSLVSQVTRDAFTKTALPLFDAYCSQSYLDNILRGGYPIFLETEKDPFVYYIYSRKHGDLERDYNFFSLAPEFFSQGNGNFRDVNQNRRNDIFFYPETGDYNIKLFMSLIQADGYNPLVVKGSSFEIAEKEEWSWLEELFAKEEHAKEVKKLLAGTYTPGDFLQTVSDREYELSAPLPELLKKVLSRSTQSMEAEFGEGYWMDHWTYNLDLIENYLKVYPDKQEQLLYEDAGYRYFSSPVSVLPRSEKYVLSGGKVRQYGALKERGHQKESEWHRTAGGEVYTSNLYSKLFTLALIKFTTLDPLGLGMEMEANKPGWNDSMNGLPGLFGSAMSETVELKRLLAFIAGQKSSTDITFKLPVEASYLLGSVRSLLGSYNDGELDDFVYWDKVADAREQYRKTVEKEFSGKEEEFSLNELTSFAAAFLEKVDKGIEKAKHLGNGLVPTYFYYEAASWEPLTDENGKPRVNAKGLPQVKVKSFDVKVLPHFLEAPARELKVVDEQTAKEIFGQVRKSDIYDSKLKMYKTSGSLEEETFEIGRSRAFTPGWLERESIFMHMEFKFLLSELKAGLYEEFFEDLKSALPPFMDPAVYGRSVLENSSFIASSVNPDPAVHGQGFVARLSGTTAEFLSIWQLMMVGKKPFILNDGELEFMLRPILPEWMFTEEGEVHFRLFGKTDVIYKNPSKRKTFGPDGAAPVKYVLYKGAERTEEEAASLSGTLALEIRNGGYTKIEVLLN